MLLLLTSMSLSTLYASREDIAIRQSFTPFKTIRSVKATREPLFNRNRGLQLNGDPHTERGTGKERLRPKKNNWQCVNSCSPETLQHIQH